MPAILDDPAAPGHPAIARTLFPEDGALHLDHRARARGIDGGKRRDDAFLEQVAGGHPDWKRMGADARERRIGVDLIDLWPATDETEIGAAERDVPDFECLPQFFAMAIV